MVHKLAKFFLEKDNGELSRCIPMEFVYGSLQYIDLHVKESLSSHDKLHGLCVVKPVSMSVKRYIGIRLENKMYVLYRRCLWGF